MGLFKVADGGTLFLDEISNISLTTQAKLLRVLQERSIVPIGDTKPIAIDIRLIAATNRDLKEMVAQGSFREDLYYRLNIIPVHLPPLRDRKGDLPVLASHFLKKFADEMGKDIKGMVPAAISMLEQYDFPGNVRELENIIERSVVLTRSNLIQPEELEIQIPDPEELPAELTHIPETADELKQVKKKIRQKAIESVERAFLIRALDQCDWNVTRAAEKVGMQRPNFQALLKKQEISIRGKKVDI
jgi:transcriptional regulator with GAF, ATPase, and Fis domain